jgi:hypothetical protein
MRRRLRPSAVSSTLSCAQYVRVNVVISSRRHVGWRQKIFGRGLRSRIVSTMNTAMRVGAQPTRPDTDGDKRIAKAAARGVP